MIAIQLENIKSFMGQLLLSETFDRFDVTEAAITTFSTVHIDGHFEKEYYSAEELEALGYEHKTFTHWGQIRPFCFELIKGKHTPLQLKIVFRLSDTDTEKLLAEAALPYKITDINGLFLNIRYDGSSLQAVTGTSMKLFTLDKSLEQTWDKTAEKILAAFLKLPYYKMTSAFNAEKGHLMKFIYPAVFRKTETGTYKGFFPDLEGCCSEADTLEDAVDLANEAASDWLSLELSEDEPQLPSISEPDDLDLQEGDVVRNICVTIRFYEGWDE